jgi:hypothetical protein
MRTRARLATILSLAVLLPSCTSAIGVGVVVVATGAAVLAADCSDFIDITVRDVSGGRTCDATVTAIKGDERVEIQPCYHARLGEGVWQIQASLPGRAAAMTTLKLERGEECGRTVQSIELWLQPVGYVPSPPSAPPTVAPPPTAPPPPAALPPPPPAPSAAPPPTSTAPAPAQPPPPPPAAPTPSAAPPGPGVGAGVPTNNGTTKRFPDAAPPGK